MDKLKVEIADDSETLSKGLMFRKSLPYDSGMLFKFPNTVIDPAFWGKNTYIPLDIAFIDKHNTIVNINEIVPLSTKYVRGNGLCSMAIEANAGFFKENHISEGSKITISKDEQGNTEIVFQKNSD